MMFIKGLNADFYHSDYGLVLQAPGIDVDVSCFCFSFYISESQLIDLLLSIASSTYCCKLTDGSRNILFELPSVHLHVNTFQIESEKYSYEITCSPQSDLIGYTLGKNPIRKEKEKQKEKEA